MNPGVETALPEENYLNHGTTLWSWLTTDDHKRIGVMFLLMTLACFLLGGIFAMIIRLEHLTPGPTIVSALGYNRLFTLHGVTMVWLFMIPAIPSGFGNFLLPIMIGAKDVAFPRLNLATVYLFALGAAVTLWGMVSGGCDTGWTFYTPYSTVTTSAVLPVLLGIFIVGFSTILSGVNFIVTVHTMRAPGITWMKLPLFVWTIYGTAIIQTLATPVLGMVLALIGVERLTGVGVFDPSLGGDPILFQHLFWFYSHPAVYIMVLPAMGVMSEVFSAFAHKNSFSYPMIVYSTLGIAFVGFFAWGHHLFTSGMSRFDVGAFGALSMFVGIFTAIKIFTWTATLYRGAVMFKTPLFYACGFMFFLMFGGMTGVALATTSIDLHWQDTYFVVAHFHFIMVGAVIMSFMAAIHYWFPLLTGKRYPEGPALATAGLVIFGFVATFLPQFLLGNMGMPRRYYEYPQRFQYLNVASTAGASLLAFGFVIAAGYLLWAIFWGEVSERNPWQSRGYEWRVPQPPPKHNFEVLEPYDHPPHDYSAPHTPEVPRVA